jgi:SMI1 / KNR4 family (SUKH-1)
MKELLKQISIQAIALEADSYSQAEIAAQWIGRAPASLADIKATEARLGIGLPADVKTFYKATNGTSVLLTHTFGAFEPIEKIAWLKDIDAYTIECYAGMGEDYVNDLKNSIVIAGISYVHMILLIQPYGKHKKWRYWEFASYIPGETEFKGVKKYLERLHDFLSNQNKYKAEMEVK